ncbi:MAG: response regulator [Gemmatimonadetes bacterium]|nr:response regulator [Gemmatimonadota bacterium]
MRDATPEAPETILLVDDDTAVRRMAAKVLRRAGYTVLEAVGGPEALAVARSREDHIDLLLTDVVMPVMSGRELSEALVRERPETKIVFMSGYTDDDVILRGVSVAEVNFLPKPFTLDGLRRVVRRVLDEQDPAQPG